MKKQVGIIRNRADRFTQLKWEGHRRKNRFQLVGKQDAEDNNMISATTTHSDPISSAELAEDAETATQRALQLFREARCKMSRVTELQKKIGEISKLRLTCLRERDNEKYDESVSKLASEATKAILAAEGMMREISTLQPESAAAKKILKSMQSSLAAEIQECSRALRSQQQEYFRRLTEEQRRSMEGEYELIEDKQQQTQNTRIGELVSSISRLTALYKELGQLVVTQGTVIDRIDCNLEQTEQHTAKAVVHLQNANAEVSSPFADRVIKSLAAVIIMLAIILAVKYMK